MRSPSIAASAALVAVLAVVVAACGGATEATPSAGSPAVVTPAPATAAPGLPSGTPASLPPLETPAPSASASPSDPAEPGDPIGADACTGTAANRDFYRSVASSVAWDLYCPALPVGWFVDTGGYRLAGGGRMVISYRGPGGARFELREGAFCSEEDGCVPNGLDLGASPFGDRTGTLIAADDGSWANVVDAGDPIAWMAVGSGIEEDDFRAFTAGLVLVTE